MLDPRTLLTMAVHVRRRMAIAFIVPLLLAALVCLLMPPVYSATASLLVKVGREFVYRSNVGPPPATSPSTIQHAEIVASNIEIMTSRDVQEATIRDIGIGRLFPALADGRRATDPALDSDPVTMNKALRAFDKALHVDPVRRTNLVTVGFEHRQPAVAAETANRLLENFLVKSQTVYADSRVAFAENQVELDRNRLNSSDERLAQFRARTSIYASQEQLQLLLRARDDSQRLNADLDSRVRDLRERSTVLARQASSTVANQALFTETERWKSADDAESTVLRLQLEQKELLAKYEPDHPIVVNKREQLSIAQGSLSRLKQSMRDRVRTGPNDVRKAVDLDLLKTEADLASAQARRQAAGEQLASLDTQIAALTSQQTALTRLEREVAVNAESLKTSQEKLEEERKVAELDQSRPASFTVVQRAVLPDASRPLRPARLQYMLMGLVAGLAAALGVWLLSLYTVRGFLTPQQLAQALSAPTLAAVGPKG
jgi:uncharacterized protein involved in exopolysaccharide biosynthesis